MSDNNTITIQDILGYTPALWPIFVAIALYGIATLGHSIMVIVPCCWYMFPMVIGGGMNIAGFVLRWLYRDNPNLEYLYAPSVVFLLLPPNFYAASLYMIFGRLLRFLGQGESSIISVGWLTKIFVIGDILSLISQAAGSAMSGISNAKVVNIGSKVALAGLGVQLVFISLFLLIMAVSHFRMARRNISPPVRTRYTWPTMIKALYLGMTLILIRSVYRLLEFSQGNLARHEVYFYCLDSLPMWILMMIFLVAHPSGAINRRRNTRSGVGYDTVEQKI